MQGKQAERKTNVSGALRQYRTVALQVLLQGSTFNLVSDLFSMKINAIITRLGPIAVESYLTPPPRLSCPTCPITPRNPRDTLHRAFYTPCFTALLPSSDSLLLCSSKPLATPCRSCRVSPAFLSYHHPPSADQRALQTPFLFAY